MVKREDQSFIPPTNKLVKTRIKLTIPDKYHKDPIIFSLVLDYQLRVNLISAMLSEEGLGGGCFDLEVQGYRQQIDRALDYLAQLNVEVWYRGDGQVIEC
ncbi:hypothetical protein NIES4102_28190 [Chondrocystis sp. NIES-4102]|nr:hypothetical protein NIES4102_28190 [Chondrocystis sp. NIES-4102]